MCQAQLEKEMEQTPKFCRLLWSLAAAQRLLMNPDDAGTLPTSHPCFAVSAAVVTWVGRLPAAGGVQFLMQDDGL